MDQRPKDQLGQKLLFGIIELIFLEFTPNLYDHHFFASDKTLRRTCWEVAEVFMMTVTILSSTSRDMFLVDS